MSQEIPPEFLEIKKKYILYGLPETLLDELIEEAKREYEIEIGYRDVKLFYDLIVDVEDEELQEDEFYKYVISLYNDIIRGYITPSKTHTFTQLPAESLHVQVYKMKRLGQGKFAVIGYGTELITLSENKRITVKIEKIEVERKIITFPFTTFIGEKPILLPELKPPFTFIPLFIAKIPEKTLRV